MGCPHASTTPTADGVRQSLVDMLTGQTLLSDTAWQREPDHDPSPPLREFTTVRDRHCDGPAQSRARADACDLDHDHDRPYPTGPNAAWNPTGRTASLPDPAELAATDTDTAQLTPVRDDEQRPWPRLRQHPPRTDPAPIEGNDEPPPF